jgi:endonuclease YncB( thermonuclease family)
MSDVKIFWDPQGFELDSLGTNEYLRATDGDTPYVSMSIRMLSIDAPEVHYPGNTKPSRHDENLAQLAEWLQAGRAPVNDNLAAYLRPRLATGRAGTLQLEQGERASEEFRRIVDEKLTRPNGSKRRVFLRAADQPFDQYGRLLAYLAPEYSAAERDALSRGERATFNLMMVEAGWAASFPIYPSIPSYPDLELLRSAAKAAIENQRGIWGDPLTLPGYEFRMCVKLYDITKKLVDGKRLSSTERLAYVERYCADMTTLTIYYPQDYHIVPPYDRIFIWPADVAVAVGRMNLQPA